MDYNLLCSNNDSFTLSVSGLSAGGITGICAAVLLLMAVSVFVFFYVHRKRKCEYYISDVNWFFQTVHLKKIGSKNDSIYINTKVNGT